MSHQSTIERAYPVSFEPKNYEAHHNKPEEHPPDTLPSDRQPPGVDEDIDYESLEEALTS